MRPDTKGRRRMGCLARIMWALLIIIAVLAVLIILQDTGVIAAEEEPAPEPVIMTAVTPPTVTAEPWVRYDVPLEDELQQYIGQVCREYNVPTELVMAIMDPESGYDPTVIGDSGQSFGLMQVWASEHTDLCIELNCYNLLEPRQNVLAGVNILAELISWGYGVDWALSFYHGEGGELPSGYADRVLDRAEYLAESAMVVTE